MGNRTRDRVLNHTFTSSPLPTGLMGEELTSLDDLKNFSFDQVLSTIYHTLGSFNREGENSM